MYSVFPFIGYACNKVLKEEFPVWIAIEIERTHLKVPSQSRLRCKYQPTWFSWSIAYSESWISCRNSEAVSSIDMNVSLQYLRHPLTPHSTALPGKR